MNHNMEDVFDYGDRVPIVPLGCDRSYGGVPGLPDEELADPAELERQAFIADWGPILSLPVKSVCGGFRPMLDEEGNTEGAFASADFERLHGPFDKARFKADKLEEEVRDATITLDIVSARLTPQRMDSIRARFENDAYIIDDLKNDEFGYARWHLRVKRLQSEIQDLRRHSWGSQHSE